MIREMKRFRQEEEEEEKEIWESFRRLAYMLEYCQGDDTEICRLVEEQQDRLNVLYVRKGEFLESVKDKNLISLKNLHVV